MTLPRWNDAALALLKGKIAFLEVNPRAKRVVIRVELGATLDTKRFGWALQAALRETPSSTPSETGNPPGENPKAGG